MTCPNCKSIRIRVIWVNSFIKNNNNAFERKRGCNACKHTWRTIEIVFDRKRLEEDSGKPYSISLG